MLCFTGLEPSCTCFKSQDTTCWKLCLHSICLAGGCWLFSILFHIANSICWLSNALVHVANRNCVGVPNQTCQQKIEVTQDVLDFCNAWQSLEACSVHHTISFRQLHTPCSIFDDQGTSTEALLWIDIHLCLHTVSIHVISSHARLSVSVQHHQQVPH